LQNTHEGGRGSINYPQGGTKPYIGEVRI